MLFSNSTMIRYNSICSTAWLSISYVHLQFTLCPQQKLPDKKVTNFTSDWNDGTLVGALVDAMAPGLCPEHEAMDPSNAFQNANHAMKLAEDWLDVPQVRTTAATHGWWLVHVHNMW